MTKALSYSNESRSAEALTDNTDDAEEKEWQESFT